MVAVDANTYKLIEKIHLKSYKMETSKTTCNKNDCTTIPYLIKAPSGSFSALDFTKDEEILCFDDRRSQLTLINFSTGIQSIYTVPRKIHFGHYYWSHLKFITNDIIMVLLKHHDTKRFHLSTLKLSSVDLTAEIISKLRTNFRGDGYQVSFQRRDDAILLFGFSIYKNYDCKYPVDKYSDIKLFHQQFADRLGISSLAEKSIDVKEDTLFDEAENAKSISIDLLSILEVCCDNRGHFFNIKHFAVSNPGIDMISSKPSNEIPSLFDTECLLSAAVRGPFYCNGFMYLIDKRDPSQVIVMERKKSPYFMALLFLTKQKPSFKRVEIENSCEMVQNSSCCAWSNFLPVHHNNYVFIQDTNSMLCTLWTLESDPHRDAQLLEHGKDEYSDRQMDNTGQINVESFTGNSREVSSRFSSPEKKKGVSKVKSFESQIQLKWTKIRSYSLPNTKILDNCSLKFDEINNRVLLRGFTVDERKMTLDNCFIKITL